MIIAPLMPLIAVAKEEDPDRGAQFERLVIKHQHRLISVAVGILKNNYDAEDAVQVAFTKVWTHFEEFEDRSDNDVKALLTTYVSNAAKDIRRTKNAKKNQTVPLSYADDEKDLDIPDEFDMEKIILTKELAEKVAECAAELSDTDRHLLLLRYHYHYSSSRIAEVMNLTVGNVNVKMRRAKARLYKKMETYLNG